MWITNSCNEIWATLVLYSAGERINPFLKSPFQHHALTLAASEIIHCSFDVTTTIKIRRKQKSYSWLIDRQVDLKRQGRDATLQGDIRNSVNQCIGWNCFLYHLSTTMHLLALAAFEIVHCRSRLCFAIFFEILNLESLLSTKPKHETWVYDLLRNQQLIRAHMCIIYFSPLICQDCQTAGTCRPGLD